MTSDTWSNSLSIWFSELQKPCFNFTSSAAFVVPGYSKISHWREQIISINFEDIDFEELTDYRRLYSYLKERLVPGKVTYIFLDEIQNVEDFPKVSDSLYIKKNVDIYTTSSNAYMLSSELTTLISGRYVQIEMLPLSFKEYMESTGSMTDRGVKYTEYLENSSFPYTLELKGQPDEIRVYPEGLYNTIVVKDIVSRKRITDTMSSDGRKIDTKTVEKYLEALPESYIIYQAKRYNIKGKQYLKTLEKYYVVDIGLRYMLLGSRQMDAGHILESVVYLELLRRGYDVYVGKIDSFEVDFVVQNSKGTWYYRVALSVRDEKTFRCDKQLREDCVAIYEALGMDLNTAFRMFMERTRMVRGLPFPAVLPETRMTKTEAQKALDDIRAEAAGTPEMSLDEINAEIRAAREERKKGR